MQLDKVRAEFEAAGHHVSIRDDVDAAGAAWFLDCRPKTMANWRSSHRGPPYVRLPSGVRYPIAGLFSWLQENLIRAV